MPGTDLNLDLPTGQDTMADIVAKIVEAIETIETDLAARITAGELDISTEVSMGGAPLTNVGGIRLVGGESDVVGTLYMDEELHAVTAAGNVQITANGGINVAALGTIGGDYGGSNPAAVTFDDISAEYRFTEAPGEYAHVVGADVILTGAAGSIRLSCNAGVSGAKTVSFKEFPAAGISPMVYNEATSTVEDGAVTRVTNTALFTSINASGDAAVTGAVTAATVTAATDINHTAVFSKSIHVGKNCGGTYSLNDGVSGASPKAVVSSAQTIGIYASAPLREGDRVKSVILWAIGQGGSTAPTIAMLRSGPTGITSSTPGAAVLSAGAVTGTHSYTFTPTTPLVLGSGEDDILTVTPAGGVTTDYYKLIVNYDHPV